MVMLNNQMVVGKGVRATNLPLFQAWPKDRFDRFMKTFLF